MINVISVTYKASSSLNRRMWEQGGFPDWAEAAEGSHWVGGKSLVGEKKLHSQSLFIIKNL